MSTLGTKSGQVVTDEMIEALASEAEVGYDLASAKRRDVGPPSREDAVSPRLQFRVDQSTYGAAKARAVIEGRTVSELARIALESYLSKVPGSSVPKAYHVIPAARQGWAIRAVGASRPSGYYRTQRDAVAAATRGIGRTGGQVVIHSANGRVRRVNKTLKPHKLPVAARRRRSRSHPA